MPADIQTKEGKTDFLFLENFASSCPKAYATAQKGMKSLQNYYLPNITSTITKLNDLGYNSKDLFGVESWNLPAISDLFDVFRAHLWQYGKQFSDNITQEFYSELENLYTLHFTYRLFSSDNGRKLWTHSIIQNLLDQFKLKTSGTIPDLKYIMYSAHDDNLVPFMVAYNLTSTDCVWKKYQSSQQKSTNPESPSFEE